MTAPWPRNEAEKMQQDFYTATSSAYDEMHVAEGDEHFLALSYISSFIDGFGYDSALDVGTGTGRGVKHLLEHHPSIEVRGLEPVRALIDEAEGRHQIPVGTIVEGRADPLPFADGSYDAVCELGVLHHVPDPQAVVAEMMRVARRAVFLSDENRFARGRRVGRVAKYALHRAGLWDTAYRLATGGRSYRLNPGDGGVVYSYSVYDSLPALNEWADRVFLIPTDPVGAAGWFHPLFNSHHVLLCALRD